MTKCIINRHIANNNLCLNENVGGALRKWLRVAQEESAPAIPSDLIRKAFDVTFKTVKHDIFPRFQRSPLAQELLYVHLGRTLQHQALRAEFQQALDPVQRDALALWEDICTYEEASSVPLGRSRMRWEGASRIFQQHQDAIGVLAPEEHVRLKSLMKLALQNDEASADGPAATLFDGAKAAAQNQLAEPYLKFVSTVDSSKRHLADMGVKESLILSATLPNITSDQGSARGDAPSGAAPDAPCSPMEMDYTEGW